MRFKWTEDATYRVITSSIILIVAIVFYFAIQNIGKFFSFVSNVFSILTPFIVGFAIAYLLSRPVNFIEALLNKFFFKKLKKQLSINRAISIFVIVILVLLLLTLVIGSIIPQLIDSVSTLARNADSYIKSVNRFFDSFAAKFNLDSSVFDSILGSSQELFKNLTQYISSVLPKIFDFSLSVGSGISNFFIGLVISIYMLSGKERFGAQIKKGLFALFPKKIVDKSIWLGKYIDETFGNYIFGQVLDSIILGIICFILMSIFRMEYALLISMIVMITNFIPFIGPFIGAIPSAFILLMVQPSMVIWFILMIVVLQQLDGNLLAPKIVGKTTGLSSFWVIFSILLGGGLFGISGVVLAVPTFSVFLLIIKHYLEKRLKKNGLPTDSNSYL